MSDKKLGLDDAYSVQTPADNLVLYRDWAATYETDFAQARGYVYHEQVVRVFAAQVAATARNPRDLAVLDVGCGTGLAGAALRSRGFLQIDGIDLSPEMLAQAARKDLYRTLAEADVTQPLPIADGVYDGLISVGTFTHGHLGPEPLPELVRVVAPGAVVAIGINAEHFAGQGFAAAFYALRDTGSIGAVTFDEVPMYAAADDEHGDDCAVVAGFRRS